MRAWLIVSTLVFTCLVIEKFAVAGLLVILCALSLLGQKLTRDPIVLVEEIFPSTIADLRRARC